MPIQMTKRGQQDNIATYEFVCDSTADLQNIESKYITLGSVAIVLQGSYGLEVYMANSKKQWITLSVSDNNSTNQESAPITDQGTADNMILQE